MGSYLTVKTTEPTSQRAHLDCPLTHDDVLALALGEHQSDIELLGSDSFARPIALGADRFERQRLL